MQYKALYKSIREIQIEKVTAPKGIYLYSGEKKGQHFPSYVHMTLETTVTETNSK